MTLATFASIHGDSTEIAISNRKLRHQGRKLAELHVDEMAKDGVLGS